MLVFRLTELLGGKLKSMNTIHPKQYKGFTLVELLIVIVIIGILAVISTVAYNGITGRANDASISADLANFQKKVEIFRIDEDRYPQSYSELESLGMKFSKGGVVLTNVNIQYCSKPDRSSYALLILSSSGKRLYVTSEGSVKEYTGDNLWTGTNYDLKCRQVLTDSSYVAGGYIKADASPWKDWTGVR